MIVPDKTIRDFLKLSAAALTVPLISLPELPEAKAASNEYITYIDPLTGLSTHSAREFTLSVRQVLEELPELQGFWPMEVGGKVHCFYMAE